MPARIVFNSDGFKQLLNSPEVEALVLSEAQRIAETASAEVPNSEGYSASSVKAGTRFIAFASTTDAESMEAEAENKTLSRAVIPHG